jgi:serine/threonine protein kinase
MTDDDAEDSDLSYEEKVMTYMQNCLRFDQIKKLGEGGMGMTYRGRFLKDGTVRVLKINKAKFEGTDDELLDEGKRLQSLAHPHVAVLYDLHKEPEFSYLNMEYCRGGDLHHRCLVVVELFSCFNCQCLEFGFKFGV